MLLPWKAFPFVLEICLFGALSSLEQLRKQHTPTSPMDVVTTAEAIVKDRKMKPESILFLDVGSVLTQGSFRTNCSVLWSMFWSDRDDPGFLRDPRTKHSLLAQTALWQALAVPLKIIVVVWRKKVRKDDNFFRTDFVRNIRHKLLFVFATMESAYTDLGSITMYSRVVWLGGKLWEQECFENRDNLMSERVPVDLSTCSLNPPLCETRGVREFGRRTWGLIINSYRVQIRCNTTRYVTYLYFGSMRSEEKDRRLESVSGFAEEFKTIDCYGYIPLAAVDVTTLMKPFAVEVWVSVFASVLLLSIAWSFVVHESALVFSSEVSLSVLTVREVPLSPRTYSGTMLGCVTLAFTFLIGQLYSNTVMAAFLDPSIETPDRYPVYSCDKLGSCGQEGYLRALLEYGAVCGVPHSFLGSATKPLRKIVANYPVIRFLEVGPPLCIPINYDLHLLPLAPSQKSKSIDRMIQHGLVSVGRRALTEERVFWNSFFANRDRSGSLSDMKMKLKVQTHKNLLHAPNATLNARDFTYASFTRERDRFDMENLLKIRGLIEVCLALAIGTFAIEMCYVKRCKISKLLERLLGIMKHVFSKDRQILSRPPYGGIRRLRWFEVRSENRRASAI